MSTPQPGLFAGKKLAEEVPSARELRPGRSSWVLLLVLYGVLAVLVIFNGY
ncbi:hypothetical protein [Thiolapillus sp.]|uniref:hypothetical protein n=1 Tax=Thiolapillus sp. TaxID=2017437 RepID=UPI003AF95327